MRRRKDDRGIPGARLVGRRISADTELGKEIAKLRELYGLSATTQLSPDQLLTAKEAAKQASRTIALHDGIDRDNRRRAIRKQMSDAYDAASASGQPPQTMGVPRSMLDEAKHACAGLPFKVVEHR